jgi:hypothetical protein
MPEIAAAMRGYNVRMSLDEYKAKRRDGADAIDGSAPTHGYRMIPNAK